MKKKRYSSIRRQLYLYFTIFAIAILMLIWLLQIVLLNTNYTLSRKNTLKRVSKIIQLEYTPETLQDTVDKYAISNDLCAFICNERGQVVYLSHYQGISSGRLMATIKDYQLRELCSKTMKNDNKELIGTIKNHNDETEFYVLCKALISANNNTEILFLAASLDPMNSTTVFLSNQLLYISVFVLALAAFVSLIIANRFSKPIQAIAKASREISEGVYDEHNINTHGILELAELSSTLDYASEEISQVTKLRRELIANTSHDLRTPLTMIKGYAEMIRDISGDNPEKRERHLETIIEEADRLSYLVNDLLDISRIESGKTSFNIEEVDLNSCINEILSKLNVVRERDGFKFIINSYENCIVMADKSRITQVIYNLIGNAISHSGEDKTIIISLVKTDKGVKTEITDHGAGIPKEELPDIWERYYRSSETHKRSIIGSGLGLSIVKNILIEHNANFGVRSKLGQGSTFYFELSDPSNFDHKTIIKNQLQ